MRREPETYLGSLKLVTRLASESGSMIATTRTSGYSKASGQRKKRLKAKPKLTSNDGVDIVNICLVESFTAISDRVFSVGGLGVAITVGEIVDDDLNNELRSGRSLLSASTS